MKLESKFVKKSAFTLIELLIVILIIGILATIAIVSYNGATARAKRAATIQIMNDTINAVAVCLAGGKNLPTSSYVTWYNKYLIQTGYNNINFKNRPICSEDETLVNTRWPNGDINGYDIDRGDIFYAVLDKYNNLLWINTNGFAKTSIISATDLSDITSTIAAPGGNTAMDITCTVKGCK
ncbi:hypothetical protein COT78_01190 [Candidatus Berkelbacteria bacterium CG10_big_fil_rev_8_21_14_0_10_43_13]|uniref:Type II secretion system protein GspG C-terminal domain-containing protein n=1 Tax=Candidatus Berkelbacteria bacterium CG10_big_fil_rev_8_21_14_0_10_43_13 TaxID=1974514 RepID=A0A2H0W6W7_9BACT|nr:MAG: hypothetical protein COT78_01190 [Candidatus Berkelbacteria bacterium CG10_big_fil_rev_8_21_14_0_10_43_13]